MSESAEYIEAYFNGQLSESERRQFEERCSRDEGFACEVAIYITISEGIRQKLLEQKRQEWNTRDSDHYTAPVKRFTFKRWLPYAAAACLILALAISFLFNYETPHHLADKFISGHFIHLSQTMDASKDSLQQGIAAYNNKDYNKALEIFQKINQSYSENSLAKKYTGLVYLITKDYDKALQQFDQLAAMKDQFRNPGLFLKAVTLLERNQQEDKIQAKQLLEQIKNQNAEGKKEAEKWLNKW